MTGRCWHVHWGILLNEWRSISCHCYTRHVSSLFIRENKFKHGTWSSLASVNYPLINETLMRHECICCWQIKGRRSEPPSVVFRNMAPQEWDEHAQIYKIKIKPLTVAAVLSSIPQRTVAEESLPAHPARSTVLTRVGLTEGEFGATAYSQMQTQMHR